MKIGMVLYEYCPTDSILAEDKKHQHHAGVSKNNIGSFARYNRPCSRGSTQRLLSGPRECVVHIQPPCPNLHKARLRSNEYE